MTNVTDRRWPPTLPRGQPATAYSGYGCFQRTVDPGGIRLSQLSKAYGPIRAVRGIDVEICSGNTVAWLGPNEAGKTTTIDMMLGLTRPDAGSVSIFDRPPTEAVKAGLARRLAAVDPERAA